MSGAAKNAGAVEDGFMGHVGREGDFVAMAIGGPLAGFILQHASPVFVYSWRGPTARDVYRYDTLGVDGEDGEQIVVWVHEGLATEDEVMQALLFGYARLQRHESMANASAGRSN